MKTRLAIIDADSIIYIVAWKFRNKNIANLVKMHVNSFITGVLDETGATDFIGFYGSKESDAAPNFRYTIDPEYKKTRPPSQDFITKWRPVIHEQMKTKWGFLPVSGMEADDAVAITVNKYKNQYDSIVVITADKDLKQIPDITHYDMSKRISTEINQFEADKFLATQMLKGDPGDSIKGLPNIGPKKAVNVLADCTTSVQLKWTVIRMYKEHLSAEYEKFIKKHKEPILTAWKKLNEQILLDTGYNTAQIDRAARLHTNKELQTLVQEKAPTNWKTYIVQQYKLLHMLTEAPDGFILPDIQSYTSTTANTPPTSSTSVKSDKGITDISADVF